MNCRYSIALASFFIFAGCNGANHLNNASAAKAVNAYLLKHGEACTVIDRQFPLDLPRSEQNEQYGIGSKLAVLERAGLLHSSDTTAVVHGMLDPLRGTGPAQAVKQYELTESGKKYYQRIVGALGNTTGFCYGQKSVDSIVKWTEPTTGGGASRAEITYTYKIANPASWAQRPDVQAVFSDIRSTMTGSSKTTEVVGLQSTSNGWEVQGQ